MAVSRGMCVNWNELQYLACTTSELQPVAAAATRSAIATCKAYKFIEELTTMPAQTFVCTRVHVRKGGSEQ